MNFILLLTVVSSICTIVGFILNLFISKFIKSEKWKWVISLFILTFSSGYAVYYNSENERIKNIHRQATVIYEDYNSFSPNKAFIQESLAFLEENQDRYPDSYERAVQIYSDMKNSVGQYDYEPAIEIRGIIKGIAALNGE